MKKHLLLMALLLGSMMMYAQNDSVYYFNQNGWDRVFCYAWNDSTGAHTDGAGIPMEITNVAIGEAHMYKCAVPTAYNKLFFNDGNTERAIREAGKNYYVNGQWMTRAEMEALPDPTAPVLDTIFFVNTQAWDSVRCYAWDKYGVSNQAWPGAAMTKADYQIKGSDVYYYLVDTTKTKCVFNGANNMQTEDLTWHAGKYYYNGDWKTRAEAEYVAPVVRDTVYFVNDSAWTEVRCYAWKGEGEATVENNTWPGDTMAKTDYQIKGYDVYYYLVDTTLVNCIFNNNNNGHQTRNLTTTMDKYYFGGQWMTRAEAEYVAPIVRDTIYFVNEAAWTNLHCYAWKDSVTRNAVWPGDTMQLATYQLQGKDVYYYLVDTTLTNCIFNNGTHEDEALNQQTANLAWEAKKYYFNNTWMTRAEVEAYVAPAPAVDTVYYVNTQNWQDVYCYAWNADGSENNAAWPGETMTNTQQQVKNAYIYTYTMPVTLVNCIFHNNGGAQTADLQKEAGKYYYNNQWMTLDEINAFATSTSQVQGRSESEKYMGEDGKVKIRNGESVYDASGRKISE